ncbi:MAG TPA: N-6 DNA methylase [Steroidobacteraceae bacterium]|nr:N-6 DNA methylase [Steroidobacteraceae bacterium]
MNTNDIVQKLWNLCNILKDDGITYHQYVTELTQLMFLKMAEETKQEQRLPKSCRWANLRGKDGNTLAHDYRAMLVDLGAAPDKLVAAIYANAHTNIREPKHLAQLIDDIDHIEWYGKSREDLGDLYEGLLQKNATETKSGAGQYFTPRPLIDCMVQLMQPKHNEIIQDPASGTGGFLINAFAYIKKHTKDLFDLSEAEQNFLMKKAFHGVELVPDTQRLGLMNCMLHGLEGVIQVGNSLGVDGERLPKADLILTNPPFGTKRGGGLPTRTDFTYPTSNKQLAFLQHIYRGLKPGGRAAVVLPDNVLFESNTGAEIRRDLMDKCNLHTILRLPTGIFYAQGVKTNVLFFARGEKDKGNTKEVWVFDLRANMPQFGKRTVLGLEHFEEFIKAFGKDPLGSAKSLARRKDTGEAGRFRKFTREQIAERGDSLDIAWLKDDSEGANDELPEPTVLAKQAMEELSGALDELRGIMEELGEEIDEVEA